MQGVNGVVQYPKGFLKEAFKLVRERGGVCIADEVSVNARGQFGAVGTRQTERSLFRPSLYSRQKAATLECSQNQGSFC